MKNFVIAFVWMSHCTLFAQNYKFGKVSKEELQEKFYPTDSTADAAYLFKSRITYYDYQDFIGDFVLITEYRERIKIYTKKGFEMATKSIPYYTPDHGKNETVSSIKGYTFSLVNGKVSKEKLSAKDIFKEKRSKFVSIKKITMPNIKKGCVIELRYSIASPYSSNITDLQFQYGIPVKKLSYKVEIPEYYIFNKKSKGYYFAKMVTESKSGTIKNLNYRINVFKFNDKNIPALRDDEPFVANIHNYRGGVKFELTRTDFSSIGGGVKSYANSWENVSKQVYRASKFGSELEKSSYYKNDLKNILAKAKTVPDKIASIFNFVKQRVKWNGYYQIYTDKGVREAYKDREGNVADINLMLTAMLRSAGLNADPVLVSTRANGVPFFPTIEGFNYVISLVEIPSGGYILLDATERYSTPNILPRRALNWNGRRIGKDGHSSWVKLTSSKPASEENNLIIQISDDLIVNGLMKSKFSNLSALTYRKNHNHLKEENVITSLEEEHGIEIEDFKLINENAIDKPIIRNIKFNTEDAVEDINGKLYIEPLLFLAEHKNPFKLE
ncbi:MAG: DUF3857 domain-containing protein, partial [Polaribacter sp.]